MTSPYPAPRFGKLPGDLAALHGLALYGGEVEVEGRAGTAPLLKALANVHSPHWDFLRFDAAVCAAGVAAFVRATSPADQPPWPAPRIGARWLLVAALEPGARIRRGVDLWWTG
jgi:hypothetical protein